MFEVVVEDVLGRPTEVYRKRMRSLREIPAAARHRGDENPFIVFGHRRIGFGTFVDTANSVSWGLARAGVGPGDRVAILSANNPEWCLAFWGTVGLGAVAVGLNGWWAADEIAYGVNDSGATVLVADRGRLDRVAGSLDRCPGLRAVFVIGEDGRPGPVAARPFDELTSSPTESVPDSPIAEDDPAVILYTSGTTGRPKGAVGTHRNLLANLQNVLYVAVHGTLCGERAGPKAGQNVSLFSAPLFHVSGLHGTLVTGLLAGLRLVMPEGRFDPVRALELIEREQVTTWVAVPTMVSQVCAAARDHGYDTSSLRRITFGGSPSAAELQRLVRDTFPNVEGASNVYGLTESASVATVLSSAEAARKPGSVGQAVPTVRIRVVDAAGADAAPGEAGEVLLRGPTVMPGYWGRPAETAEVIDGDGWLRTGDIGVLDEEGFLSITDRAKDVIIRGGENVYCVEIENRLAEHPAVVEAAVVGVAHPTLGEEVKAVVRAEAGCHPSAEDLRAWVGATLASFKVPAHVEVRHDPLPRNDAGKLRKELLRSLPTA